MVAQQKPNTLWYRDPGNAGEPRKLDLTAAEAEHIMVLGDGMPDPNDISDADDDD